MIRIVSTADLESETAMSERRLHQTWLAVMGWVGLTGLVLSTATSAAAHKPRHDPAKGGDKGAHHAPAAHPADPPRGSGGTAHDPAGHGSSAPPSPAPGTGMVFLAADLTGGAEVPVAGGPAAGDPDGHGRAVVRIFRDQVCWTTTYGAIDAPTAAHIHAGAAGANGGLKAVFFATALPSSLWLATGCITQDRGTIEAIVADPQRHYVNLHTAAYPGGAVRGQLRKLDAPVDLLESIPGGSVALMDGTQEVPEPGDQDGHAAGYVRLHERRVDFAFSWGAIAPPTAGHLHPGLAGQANPLAVEFFAAANGLPPSVRGVAGTADVGKDVLRRLRKHPQEYYLNLHNGEYAKGAVRGQLSRR